VYIEAYLGGKCIILGPGVAGTILLSHDGSIIFFLFLVAPCMDININEISQQSNMKLKQV
jgi:hypothetical protein